VVRAGVRVLAVRDTWGEDRVFFFGDDGTQVRAAWIDAADVDVFVTVATGRSPFGVAHLLVLAEDL
jgi:Family of unknown function (DUF5372)